MQPPNNSWNHQGAKNVLCVYCCGRHTYDYCPPNPDSIYFDGEVGDLTTEINVEVDDALNTDTEDHEAVEKDHSKFVLVESEKEVEISQITSNHEGYVDDSSQYL